MEQDPDSRGRCQERLETHDQIPYNLAYTRYAVCLGQTSKLATISSALPFGAFFYVFQGRDWIAEIDGVPLIS